MITDPAGTAGLTVREVRSSTRDGAPTKVVVARRRYPTGQGDLWDAVTDAERIPRWFLPISGDLSVGGRYQFEGNAGGSVERCDEPTSFAVTWEYGPMVSWLEIRIIADGPDAATLELIHEAPVDPDLWQQFGPNAVGLGWDLGLLGLGLHLGSGEPVDAEIAATFSFSPEGITFIRTAAAADWARAASVDGDDLAQAGQAAERTVALYTTAPEPPPANDSVPPGDEPS